MNRFIYTKHAVSKTCGQSPASKITPVHRIISLKYMKYIDVHADDTLDIIFIDQDVVRIEGYKNDNKTLFYDVLKHLRANEKVFE